MGVVAVLVGAVVVGSPAAAFVGARAHLPFLNVISSKAISPATSFPTIPSNSNCKEQAYEVNTVSGPFQFRGAGHFNSAVFIIKDRLISLLCIFTLYSAVLALNGIDAKFHLSFCCPDNDQTTVSVRVGAPLKSVCIANLTCSKMGRTMFIIYRVNPSNTIINANLAECLSQKSMTLGCFGIVQTHRNYTN